MNSKENSRRLFLKQALLVSAAAALPAIWTRTSGQTAPTAGLAPAGERVNLACIGIGNQGDRKSVV